MLRIKIDRMKNVADLFIVFPTTERVPGQQLLPMNWLSTINLYSDRKKFHFSEYLLIDLMKYDLPSLHRVNENFLKLKLFSNCDCTEIFCVLIMDYKCCEGALGGSAFYLKIKFDKLF